MPSSANIINIMIMCAGVVGAAQSVLVLTPAEVDDLCSLHLGCLRNVLAGTKDPTAPAQEDPQVPDGNTNTSSSSPFPLVWDDLALGQFLHHQHRQERSPVMHISTAGVFHGRRLSNDGFGAGLDGTTVLHAVVASCDSSTAGSEADSCSDSDDEEACSWPCESVVAPWSDTSADVSTSTPQQAVPLMPPAPTPVPAPTCTTPPGHLVLDAMEQLLLGVPAAAAAAVCKDLWHLHLQGLRTDLSYLMLCPPGLFCPSKPESWDARMYISVLAEVVDYLSRQQLWHLLAALLQHLAASGLRLQQGNRSSVGRRFGAPQLRRIFAEAKDGTGPTSLSQSGAQAQTPVPSPQRQPCARAPVAMAAVSAPSPYAGFWDDSDAYSDAYSDADAAVVMDAAAAACKDVGMAGSRGTGCPAGGPSTYQSCTTRNPPLPPGSMEGTHGCGSAHPPPSPTPPLRTSEEGAAAAAAAAAARPCSGAGTATGHQANRSSGYSGAVSARSASKSRRRSSGYRCARTPTHLCTC